MKDDLRRSIAGLRKGDVLRISSLSDLATKVVDVLAMLETIHGRGAVAVDSEGRRSDRDLVTMLQTAMPKLRKGTTRRVARAAGSKGGRKPNAKIDNEAAELIWHDARLTIPQKLKKMRGWYYKLAFDTFGPTGRKRTGRPKAK